MIDALAAKAAALVAGVLVGAFVAIAAFLAVVTIAGPDVGSSAAGFGWLGCILFAAWRVRVWR